MSDFPQEEPDPEMAADDEESAEGLVELLDEITENEEREEVEGLIEPDVEFDLETEPVTMNEDPKSRLQFSQVLQKLPALQVKKGNVVIFAPPRMVRGTLRKRRKRAASVTNWFAMHTLKKYAAFVFRIYRCRLYSVSFDW